MEERSILDKVKLAMHPPIMTKAFDEDLNRLIGAAKQDLTVAGITNLEPEDALITQAILTYVLMNFGEPSNYDRLKASYDEQKKQLGMYHVHTIFAEVVDV